MEHETGSVLPFLVLSLGFGAAIRHFLRQTPFPYTVALLLFGLLVGFAESKEYLGNLWPELGASVNIASSIDPHLILLLFLPTLIFESAFSMDTHIFRRSLTQVVILAVPGLLLSTVVVGWFAIHRFPWSWDWNTALMFGAIISATDPVAVVALLKELGASKQLATLIEGESLLNDGTAIVVFLLFYAAVVSGGLIGTPFHIGMDFAWKSIGGPIIGVLIASGTIVWIRHVFNDALVEITVTIVAAYVTYYLAENVLHSSGVLAVVALGLLLAGVGRTSISPEVEGFLHRFWEMMAYLLNTLIFILVGVVIALNVKVDSYKYWLILAELYIAIHIVRAVIIFIFYPLMKRMGYGLPWREGTVLMWGGLRGAVGLSLALMVAQNPHIPEAVRGQVLFLCAGIVVLTLTINGTTIRSLISFLGMDTILPARVLMLSTAAKQIHKENEETLELLKQDRFLSGADWEHVRTYLPEFEVPVTAECKTDRIDLAKEARRRILESEKRSYWSQHHEGFLGPDSVRRLAESVDTALDGSARLDERIDLEKLWRFPPMLRRLKSAPIVGNWFRYLFYGRLAVSYDVARGFVFAQEEISGLLKGIVGNEEIEGMLRKEGNNNRQVALTALKNMREAFPEITVAIETKTAVRSVLNHERKAVHKMRENGVLNAAEAGNWVEIIETRMKQVHDTPPAIELPNAQRLLREIPWLSQLDTPILNRVEEATREQIYAPGEKLIKEGSPSDSLCVIARGTVRVSRGDNGDAEKFLDLVGPGSVMGEMGVLTGSPRTATVKAETPVNALWISAVDLRKIMNDSPEMTEKLWQTAGARFAENYLVGRDPYNSMGQLRLRRWLLKGELETPEDGKLMRLKGPAVLLTGEAVITEDSVQIIAPPAVIEPSLVTFRNNARVYLCPSSEVVDTS